MSEEFDREIEFMKTIGYHSRLVNMLAVVSDADDQKLVLEYCANGDLLYHLREIHEQVRHLVRTVSQCFSAENCNLAIVCLAD